MKITHYTLNGPKLKVAILADIHDSPIFEVFDFFKHNQPDIILIPGDIITGHLTYDAWKNDLREENLKNAWKKPRYALDILKTLPQIAPTFLSLGNHEYLWQQTDIEMLQKTGTIVLDNTFEIYKDFVIGGLTSVQKCGHFHLKNPVPKTFWLDDFCIQKGFKILLMHEPQLYPQYIQKRKIDLTVSGHAHGGQIRIPFIKRGLYAPDQGFFPYYTKGWYDEKHLLVSAGLSNTVPFMPRLFNPRELVLLDIKNLDDEKS